MGRLLAAGVEGFSVRGVLGDATDPWGYDVIEERTGERFALTLLTSVDRSNASAVADAILRGSIEPAPHFIRSVAPSVDAELGLLSTVPGGRALSEVLRLDRALMISEAKVLGLDLLTALALVHQQQVTQQATSDRGAARLVHNHVRPSAVHWALDVGATLTGFGSAVPSSYQDLALFPSSDPYVPGDLTETGNDTTIDLYACAALLHESLTLTPSFTVDESDLPAGLAEFFRKALAPSRRQRFGTAEEMRDAWAEAAGSAAAASVPGEWQVLEIALQEAVQASGVSVPPTASAVEMARGLLALGLDYDLVRDVEALDLVKHDIKGELHRFREFTGRIIEGVRTLVEATL